VANQKGLRLVGWAYGGLAMTVMLVAFMVVSAHINGQVQAKVEGQVEARAETQAFRLPN
jgi:phage-related holin